MIGAVGLGFSVMVLLAGTAAASAQRPDSTLDSGRVVRLHTAAGVLEVRLARPLMAAGGTVEFCAWEPSPCGAGAVNRSLRLQDVLHIDVRRSYSGRGALVGLGIGVLAGYVVGRGFEENECDTKCGASVSLAGFGGLLFAGVGAVIGSALTRWVQVR
jgi:hypothetical protein